MSTLSEDLRFTLRKAAREYLRLSDGDYWDSCIADAQAKALLSGPLKALLDGGGADA